MLNKNRLKELIDGFAKEFAGVADASRTEHMKTLKPGDRTPVDGKIYGENYRSRLAETAQQKGDEARALIEERENEIMQLMAAAPSQDAVNTISLLKMRNSLSEEELNAAFDAYGDNYTAYQVLADIAKDNKIPVVGEHPLKAEAEGLAALKRTLRNVFAVSTAESGRLTAGYLAMLEAQIDGVENNKGLF